MKIQNKKNVAIIIPNIKPYNISCRLVVDSFARSIGSDDSFGYDVIVCGGTKPDDDRIIFLQDEKLEGENYAMNFATKYAIEKGYDFFAYTADDFKICEGTHNLFKAVDFIESEAYKMKQFKIISLGTTDGATCFLGDGLPYPDVNIKIPINNKSISVNCPICRFPIVDYYTITKYLMGHLFHPSLISGYGDCYLGYFLAANGEPVIEYQDVRYEFMPHIHDLDRISRRNPDWIRRRRQSCDSSAVLINNYIPGTSYI